MRNSFTSLPSRNYPRRFKGYDLSPKLLRHPNLKLRLQNADVSFQTKFFSPCSFV